MVPEIRRDLDTGGRVRRERDHESGVRGIGRRPMRTRAREKNPAGRDSIKETAVDTDNAVAIEWKCQQAVIAFFRCLDERDHSGLAARMHPDGV